jgi:hypothetical protein
MLSFNWLMDIHGLHYNIYYIYNIGLFIDLLSSILKLHINISTKLYGLFACAHDHL